ncbi:MAG: hypothetical protein K2R93_16040 [Gemmatimonadaceae bacterium]|nr:hypothetical protein [Gemmatimonadaceae bacterium]
MLAIVGDIHQDIDGLAWIVEQQLPPEVTVVVQVGDLYLSGAPGTPPSARWRRLARHVYFIDGNHHHFPSTRGLTAPTEIAPGLSYCPRGTVLHLAGRRVAFLGGAETHHIAPYWVPGEDWWPEEEAIRRADAAPLLALQAGDIDLLITHTPPADVIAEHGGTPSVSAGIVQDVWDHLGRPELVCGHMHRRIDAGRVVVLDRFDWVYR